MRALVTGGAGFIGLHLAERLVSLGHEVKVFDLPTKIPYWQDGKTIDGIIYHVRDITQPALHSFGSPDWCFHLAAQTDVIPSIENPVAYFRDNVWGTVNVLDHCVRLGVKKLIYASSTSVYGIPLEHPTTEACPVNPCYPYALTKYLAERAVMHWGKVYGLPVVSLRITTAYGPGMKPKGYGSVFKVFMAQKANHMPFTVVGNGRQSRDFIFVSDVVDAFIKAVESDIHGHIFNVGFGHPRQIKELVELLGGGEVIHLPRRPGEPEMTWADITKIKDFLGWEPKVTLEEGVKVMLEHLDDWKEEKVWTPEDIRKATSEWFHYLGKGHATITPD